MPLTMPDLSADAGASTIGGATRGAASARSEAVEHAVDLARLAPSVHNTQPWLIVVENDGITLRADRGRQLRVSDPLGRALVQSVGAALLHLRVALAERGWAVAVDRFPRPEDPDLLAHVRPVAGPPDSRLAALAPQVSRRHTNRRRSSDETVPDELLRALVGIAACENTQLIVVLGDDHRRLVARLIQQADGLRNDNLAYRAELDRCIGGPPAETSADADQTLILLATHSDGPDAWLRTGEVLERVRLELACHGWAARPLTQPIEVPLTRTQLRSALTWNAHPQLLLRIGRAARTTATPSPAPGGDPAPVEKRAGSPRDPRRETLGDGVHPS
jgi:nitroreductase